MNHILDQTISKILAYALDKNCPTIHFGLSFDNKNTECRFPNIEESCWLAPLDLRKRLDDLAGLNVRKREGSFSFNLPNEKIFCSASAFRNNKMILDLRAVRPKLLSLRKIGLDKERLNILEKGLNRGKGFFVISGPACSGKTSLAYSLLNFLSARRLNSASLEEKILLDLPFASQTNIMPGQEKNHLRNLLKQMPDIVLLDPLNEKYEASELNDLAMKKILLATLNSNSAESALEKMYSMSIFPNLIIHQQLANSLCPYCKESYRPDYSTWEDLNEQFELENIRELRKSLFYRSPGCARCEYKGQGESIPILEICVIQNKELEKNRLSLAEFAFSQALAGRIGINELLNMS